jgi:NAD(P)-dependent dehydrogenase (short-subunit alcohol dehydrogenase family)
VPTVPSLTPLPSCNVIVTGAVGGLGSALMSAFNEMDCRVVGIDLPAAVESGVDPNRLIGADLANADSAHAAIHAAVDRLGGLDCLVGAAASVATLHRADRFPARAFSDDVGANLLSQFWTAQAAYPALVASSAASVVMVSSIGALDGLPGQASYAASKAGILGLVRTLAAEWASRSIRVNAVVPGLIATPKVMAMPRDIQDRVLANVAQKRLVSVGEVVGSIAFLMSPAAGAITGQSLRVDGGAAINTVGLYR